MEELTPVAKLTKDLRTASKTLTDTEARFLVDAYYMLQNDRIRADGQVRSMSESSEPISLLEWLGDQHRLLEAQVKISLDVYSYNHPVGSWARSVIGVGPVIAAGLLAHIDITKAPTAGHIFSFAGLNPNREWLGTKRAERLVKDVVGEGKKGRLSNEEVTSIAEVARCNVSFIKTMLKDRKTGKDKPATVANVAKALAKRPWNAQLKVICWKLGESFVKTKSHPDSFYGPLYNTRKAQEELANANGEFADQAAAILVAKRIGKDTDAYKAYSQGKLPPAHLHARAKRWVVKIFLSNLHEVWYEIHYGEPAPAPYPLAHLGHVHKIFPAERVD